MKRSQSTSTIIAAIAITLLQASCSNDESSNAGSWNSFLFGWASPSCLCDPASARDLGALMIQSSPIIEMNDDRVHNFGNWISGNAQFLKSNGPIIECARNLGNALISRGLSSYMQTDYDDAYGRVLSMGGNMDDGHAVADSMTSGALDAMMMGKELLWLAQVIPAGAEGNWEPYFSSGTSARQQFRQMIPILKVSGLGNAEQLMPYFSQYEPILQDQMVMATCLFTE